MTSRLFPAPTTQSFRETNVVWDMEGYSIPKSLDPYSIKEQIRSAIANEGYRGDVYIQAYGGGDALSKQVRGEFNEVGIFFNPEREGVEVSKHTMMLADVIFLAVRKEHPFNLLILSKNIKNLEQDRQLSRLRDSLEKKGFYVALADPDSLLDGGNPIGALHECQCGFGHTLKKPMILDDCPFPPPQPSILDCPFFPIPKACILDCDFPFLSHEEV